ncbi:MAG: superoxide dismutase [Nitrospirota bacterium]|jgi:Fe-Mn family superoxide dismutase
MNVAAIKIPAPTIECTESGEYRLPDLPYGHDGLEPYISAATLEFHYGKHHAAYIKKLNRFVAGTDFAGKTVEDIITQAEPGPLFNNAAQAWNHTFYWHCMSPGGGGRPSGDLAKVIDMDFGSYEEFRKQFTEKATTLFGSGWTWLIRDLDGKLAVVTTKDGNNPLTSGQEPLLTCDMWEHAYYLDYRNRKREYLDAFWKVVNWRFVEDTVLT